MISHAQFDSSERYLIYSIYEEGIVFDKDIECPYWEI